MQARVWGAFALAACGHAAPPPALPPSTPRELRPPQAFAAIEDRSERAAALFVEASKVMFHPRCTNCHPAGDSPTQGPGQLHDPPVTRGDQNDGVPGLRCTSCHQDHNLELARVPGAPKWALAPKEMVWQGRSAASLCAQLKDRARNGGRTLEALAEHTAHDPLIAWGWAPGHQREPAPGTQAEYGALMRAWIENGAACPTAPEASR